MGKVVHDGSKSLKIFIQQITHLIILSMCHTPGTMGGTGKN